MSLGAWNDYMGHSEEERERLHREAMAYYNAWIADRDRRHRAYDAAVDAYHARLADAVRRRDEESQARRARVQLEHQKPALLEHRTPAIDAA